MQKKIFFCAKYCVFFFLLILCETYFGKLCWASLDSWIMNFISFLRYLRSFCDVQCCKALPTKTLTNARCQTKLPLISLINWLLTKQCLFVLGIISRNCTTEGWSDVYPSIQSVCFEPSTSADKVSDWINAVRSFPELLYSHLSWKQMPSEWDFWLYTVFMIIALTILKR